MAWLRRFTASRLIDGRHWKSTGARCCFIPELSEEIRYTRAVQDWLAEGRQEGEAAVTLRLLARRCGPLSEATTARIQALPLEQLEALAEALLDFEGAEDLATWLSSNS
ncbi:MAG: DUF4351 domain-containing protein [Cyanobacteria bacterium K_DeepCast_35m_m1_288]|nr:DUF4351 domain-containing protein [Cyanobacteria bacterium K_DeepCast_35m_m1_288]